MKVWYLSSGVAGLALAAVTASWAQGEQEGFSTQQNTAGWDEVEPEPDPLAEDLEAVLSDSEPVQTGPIMRDGQPMGWQFSVTPIDLESMEDPETQLTELERLSISASGVRYGSGLYDPKSDNPLVPVAVTLRALDKITAKYTDLVIEIDETSTYGELEITPKTCDTRPPEEFPETTAFLVIDNLAEAEEMPVEVDDESTEPATETPADTDAPLMEVSVSSIDPAEASPEEIAEVTTDHYFSGWMFASSPALNALEHPVYDVWVIDCKMVDPSTLADSE